MKDQFLQGPLVFLAEDIRRPVMKENDPQCVKRFIMLFSRELLNGKYKNLKTEIENILLKISEETNLLEDDNLARGELVQGVTIRSRWKKMKMRIMDGGYLITRAYDAR